MNIQLTIPAFLALIACSTQATGQQLYRWVDDSGQVHYGDHVPPAYANQEREILNDHGVSLRTVEGAASEAELAERDRLAAEEEAKRQAAIEQANRDRVLLNTYLSVSEIERLRDQRLELLEAQIAVTESYLSNLSKRLTELRQNAGRFKPYSEDPDAPQIPANLELDLAQTADSIQLYEETLGRTRNQQQTLSEAFARDIKRFEELQGS